jgi:hypothetical protein
MRATRKIPGIRPLLAGLLALALLACGPAFGSIAPTATPVPPTATPAATPRPVAVAPAPPTSAPTRPRLPAPSATRVPAPDERLYVYDTDQGGRFLVVDGATGRLERALPAGAPNADWTILYTAETTGARTTVSAIAVATGETLRSTTLDGHFSLSWAVPDSLPTGLSRDGQMLVLASRPGQDEIATFEREERWVSRFVVLDTAFRTPARAIELAGNFSYDALAPAGGTLFLIEHRPPVRPTGEYAVRAYDLAASTLLPGAIVDKTNAGAVMDGYPLSQVVPAGGAWVYTLYRNGRDGPFIHALEASNRYALCLDLPQAGKEDEAAALSWGLALSRSGTTLYAVNSALGQLAEIDAGDARIRRIATFDPRVASPPAGAKQLTMRGVALSPDGAILLAVDGRGLLAIDTGSLTVTRRLAPDATFGSVAFGADGRSFYALDTASGTLQRRDTATGAVLGAFGGGAHPAGILRVEARR